MKKTVKIILIVVALLVVGFIGAVIWFTNAVTYEMNEKISIENENIDLVVKSVNAKTIEDPLAEDIGIGSLLAGDYFRVEVEITNNGTEDYEWTLLNFGIEDFGGNGTVPAVLLSEEVPDLLPDIIPAKQTVKGCLYFSRDLAGGKYIQDDLKCFNYSSWAIPGEVTKYLVKLY